MEKQGDKMKTYTTDEMIIVLSKIDFDITFLLEENRNIHVFNDIYRNIYIQVNMEMGIQLNLIRMTI